jgi:tetratricopeptide (TPR) repeat protein
MSSQQPDKRHKCQALAASLAVGMMFITASSPVLGQPSTSADDPKRLTEQARSALQTGDFSTAESLFKRGLAIVEGKSGAESPTLLPSLDGLGYVYQTRGRFAESELFFKRALAIRDKTFGREHPDTAATLNNLASLYQAQGRFAESELSLKRALAIQEKVLGSSHPSTALHSKT